MDILELLKTDHRDIQERISELKSDFTSPEGKLLFFRQLARIAESSAKAEEATLLDYARDDRNLRLMVLTSLEENALMEELANKIRNTDDPDAWTAKVKVYCDLLDRHISEVEVDLYPRVDQCLEAVERTEMGLRYERLRGLSLGEERRSGQGQPVLTPHYNEAG